MNSIITVLYIIHLIMQCSLHHCVTRATGNIWADLRCEGRAWDGILAWRCFKLKSHPSVTVPCSSHRYIGKASFSHHFSLTASFSGFPSLVSPLGYFHFFPIWSLKRVLFFLQMKAGHFDITVHLLSESWKSSCISKNPVLRSEPSDPFSFKPPQ